MTSPDQRRDSPSGSGSRPVRGWRPDDRHARPGAAQRARRLKIFGVLTLLFGIVGVIVWLIVVTPRSVAPVRFVGIGIGAYDHLSPNPGGRNDVVRLREHFALLHEQFGDEFRPVLLLDDNLKAGPLLKQLKDQLADAGGETLIVYCSTLGYVAPDQDGTVQLLAIHAGPDSLLRDGDGGRVAVADVLSVLSETPAKRVLVFLDITRLDPHPRLGVLARDVAAELAHDLEDQQDLLLGDPEDPAGRPRITVICSNSPGEFSWTELDPDNTTHSVFGNMLQAALGEGACDGCLPETPADGVINSDELLAYLSKQVSEWSNDHRAIPQTVRVWGDESQFDVMAFRQPSPEQDSEDASENDGDEVAAAETSDEQDAGAAAEGTADPLASGDESNTKSADGASPTILSLAEAWDRRDALARRAEEIVGSAPHAWRSLQAQLLMAEEQQRAGYAAAERDSLRIAAELFQQIEEATTWSAVHPDATHWQLSLGLWKRIAGRARPTPQDRQAFRDLQTALAQQAAQPPADPAPAETGSQAAPEGPLSTPEGRYLFAQWVVEQITERRDGIEQLQEIAAALAQLEQARMWPLEQWPAELVAAAEISRGAVESGRSEREWRELLNVTTSWYDVAATLPLRPYAVALVQPALDESGRALLATERWLRGGPATEALARTWLDKATNAVETAQTLAEEIDGLTSLEQMIVAALPGISRTVAELAELDRSRRYRPQAAAELGRLLAHDTPTRVAEVMQEALDRWPVLGEDTQTRCERELLELIRQVHLVRELWDQLATTTDHSASDVLQRVSGARRELEDRWRTFNRTRTTQQAALRSLPGLSLNDWLQVRATLNDPGWPSVDRGALARKLSSPVERPLRSGHSADVNTAPAGLWNGFWTIVQLYSSGIGPLELTESWEAWESLIQEAERPDSRTVLKRAELGLTLNRAWGELRERVSRTEDSRQQERLVRSLHGWDSVPTMIDPDEVVLRQHQAGFSQLIGTYLRWWPYRQPKPGWTSLTQRGQVVAALDRPAEEPQLAELPRVECDADRKGELQIHWSRPTDDVRVVTFGDSVTFMQNGRRVQFPDDPQPRAGTVRYDVALLDSSRLGERVTIGLTDAGGYPYDLRTVEVVPPVDPSQWRIEFSTAQGSKPIRQIDFLTAEGGQEQLGTRISLPPKDTVTLQATLILPATEPAQSVEYACWALSSSQQQTPLIPLTKVDREIGQTRIPLTLAAPAQETGSAPPAAASAAEPGGVDASRGLRFQFTADGKQDRVLEYLVLPEFLLPDQYIRRPQPIVGNGILNVPIERRPLPTAPDRDWLVAEAVPVEVEVSSVLEQVGTAIGPLGRDDLPVGDQLPASIGFQSAALVGWERNGLFGEFGVSAGGWPYAYRWQIRSGQVRPVPETGKSAVRIVEPADDYLQQRKPDEDDPDLPIQIQVYARSLDVEWQSRRRWRLECAIRPLSGQRIESKIKTWNLRASTVQSTLTQLTGGIWTFTTTADPFEAQLGLNRLGIGRYELIARVLRDEELQAEHRTGFAIDTSVPSVAPGSPPDGHRHRYDQPLTVRLQASDAESGLQQLRMGLDVNQNGQLDDAEPQYAKQFEDLDGYVPQSDLTAVFEAKQLPQKAGEHRFLMLASNRLGMESAVERHFVEFIHPPVPVKPPPGPDPPPPPTTGTLTVTASRILSKVELKGPTAAGPIKMKSGESRKFEELQPGTYTIEWEAYNDSGSTSIKIKAGDEGVAAVGK